jgi:putative ABC transport system substrate-binding protein
VNWGSWRGRNVAIEYRYADSKYERLPPLANELLQRELKVLFASGNASALAAKRATSTIPVVFAVGNDPVQMGLVDSLSRPTGNLTGVSFFTTLIGKRLELMRELTPASAKIGYLQDANNPAADLEVRELAEAAGSVDQSVIVVTIKDGAELEAAFRSLKEKGVSGLVVAAGTFEFKWAERLIELSARYSLPAIYAGRELVNAGGLISYSGSQAEAHRLAGAYCGRVLKGDRPTALPVLLPSKLELVINLKTARALGLTVPPTLLARADEVIE